MEKTLTEAFFLAPMAEISTPALRQVIKGFSKNVILCSEMLNANEIVSNSLKVTA